MRALLNYSIFNNKLIPTLSARESEGVVTVVRGDFTNQKAQKVCGAGSHFAPGADFASARGVASAHC